VDAPTLALTKTKAPIINKKFITKMTPVRITNNKSHNQSSESSSSSSTSSLSSYQHRHHLPTTKGDDTSPFPTSKAGKNNSSPNLQGWSEVNKILSHCPQLLRVVVPGGGGSRQSSVLLPHLKSILSFLI